MATPTQIRAAVDARLAALWTAIQNHETAYATNHGGLYWQGLRSHSAIPADGATAMPDIGTTTPSYQPTPWPAAIRGTAMEMALEIHQYQTPDGQFGYQVFVYVTIAGVTHWRSAQVGPESWRVFSWQQMPVGTP